MYFYAHFSSGPFAAHDLIYIERGRVERHGLQASSLVEEKKKMNRNNVRRLCDLHIYIHGIAIICVNSMLSSVLNFFFSGFLKFITILYFSFLVGAFAFAYV